MRRIKLTWFALGAGTSALFALLAWWYLKPEALEEDWTANIVLVDPISSIEGMSKEQSDLNMIADETGKILRDCGTRIFETTFLYNDHAPTADLPIIIENYDSLECVIKTIEQRDIEYRVEVRSGSRTADHMRSTN